ncbi:MAG TPA: glycosyltransferase family 39 protein [Candidatus Binatia bacterium]|nr:glycosyltransferase family 39 protein [Candidatus Binatia bacterium]
MLTGDAATIRSLSSSALLICLCSAIYLPGIVALPPIDRDEARFAQSTKQMLESGDFVRPRFQSEARYKKPIGIYWLQAGAVTLAGSAHSIWPYRLPSLAGAILAVLGTLAIGRRLFDPETGLLGAALLASSPLLAVEATVATTDAVLLACVVGAQGCLAGMHLARCRGERPAASLAAGFWAAQAVGVLVKGPVAPAVSLLTIGALRLGNAAGADSRGWVGDLRAGPGLLLFAAIVGPWAIAVGLATDWDFYRAAFAEDVLPKLLGGQESHGAPPGYYLVMSVASFWPGALPTAPAILAAVRRRSAPGEGFCLAWLIPTWVFFEIVPTKLPHYVLPTFPALALLAAHAVRIAVPELRSRTARAVAWVWTAAGLALASVLIAAPLLLGATLDPLRCAPAIATLLTTVFTARWWCSGNERRAIGCSIIGSGVVLASTLGFLLPGVRSLWVCERALDAIAALPSGHRAVTRPLAAVGYREPSLVFLLGGDIELLPPDPAARFLAAHDDGLVLVSEDQQAAFRAAATDRSLAMQEVAAFGGWNYSKGRWVRLRVFGRISPNPGASGRSPE